jgi:3-oxoacyl-[acyl-carrier-protein] synthase-3
MISNGNRRGSRAALKAIASCLPERTVTNEELAKDVPKWTPASIYQKTGIRERHIAAPGECSSDLAVRAGQRLFDSGACSPQDIDFLLLCTQSPDYFLPATACILQERLGLTTDCGALDFNQGCSGFVYGLSLAKGLIETGAAQNVLLITAETYSKFLDPKDSSTRVLFGDGAAATLIGRAEAPEELIGPAVFGTDGRGAKNLIVESGAMRCRTYAGVTSETASQHLYMNGPEVFNFTLKTIPPLVGTLLQKSGITAEEVDYFVFHQANRFMLEHLREKMHIPPGKFCINMDEYGNTVSSTIPMAIEIALAQRQIRPNNRVMVVGFGVGYSWAASMIRMYDENAE